MNYTTIALEWRSPQIAILTLNRPEKRNALNLLLLQEMQNCLLKLAKEPLLRALIINGAGPTFCAGLDLNEVTEAETRELSSQLLVELFKTIDAFSIVTIAAVHGAALAGGCGVMCACDYVLAEENTQFAFPEVKRGLVPALVAVLLERRLSASAVRELLLFGESIDAKRALSIGLINRIIPQAALLPAAVLIAEKSYSSFPEAVAETKKLLRALEGDSLGARLDLARTVHCQSRASSQAQKGIADFFKRT